MTSAKQIAKQVVQTYKSVEILSHLTQLKLVRLKESNTIYALFENPPPHPYTTLEKNGVDLVTAFQNFVSSLQDKSMASGMLRSELEMLKGIHIARGEDYAEVEALLNLPIASKENCAVDKIGEQLLLVFERLNFLLIQSSEKWIKESLRNVVSRKNIKSHIENPFLNNAPECRSAIKNTNKLAKMLLDEIIDASTIRSELAQIETLRLLAGLGDNDALRKLVAPV